MGQIITAYLATAAVFLAIDAVWLGKVATRFYFDRIGHLMMDKPNLGAAAIFYLLYVGGLVFFAVLPALKSESIWTAVVCGAVLGFIAYATYDMTNYATLRNWPLEVVFVDIAWGAFLSAVSAAAGYAITNKLLS